MVRRRGARACWCAAASRQRVRKIPAAGILSAEYGASRNWAGHTFGMIGGGAYVTNGNQRRDVGSFKEAITWLFDQARKGQTMQRYRAWVR
jgi:hypothetical protein